MGCVPTHYQAPTHVEVELGCDNITGKEDFREIVVYFPEEGRGEDEGGISMGAGSSLCTRYIKQIFSCSSDSLR